MSTSRGIPKKTPARDARLKAQYNISAEDWEIIFAFQKEICPLCKEFYTQSGLHKGEPKIFNVDHDHKSGLTRGILCAYCNGKVTEWFTIERVRRLLEYLENPPATLALGEARVGRKGRVTNKRKPRKRVVRKKAPKRTKKKTT